MVYPKYVDPLPGESLFGFLYRVASENDFDRMSDVLKDIGHHGLVEQRMSAVSLATLSERTGISSDVLHRMHISTEDPSECVLHLNDRATSSRGHVCPDCFLDTGYHLLGWHLLAMTHCPTHGTPLISSCQDCNSTLLWRRADLMHCSCGASFSTMGEKGSVLSEHDLAGLRILFEKCGQPLNWAPMAHILSEPFRELSPSELAVSFRILGIVSCFDSLSPLQRRGYLAPDGTPFISKGLEMATDWPSRFIAVLTQWPARETNTVIDVKLHRYLRNALCSNPSAGTDKILHALQTYMAATGYDGSFGIKTLDGKTHLMSRDEARQFLGISQSAVSRIADRYCLYDPNEADGSYRRWLLRDRVHVLSEKLGRHGKVLSVRTVASKLNVHINVVRELGLRSLFGDRAKWRFEMEPNLHFLTIQEYQRFLARIDAAVRPAVTPGAVSCSWSQLASQIRKYGSEQADILQAIFSGEITPEEFSERLSSLRFNKDEMLAFAISRHESSRHVKADELLTRAQAMHYVGARTNVFRRAINLGLLPKLSRREMHYTKKQLDDFLEKYTYPGIVGRRILVDPAHIGRLFLKHGLKPVGGDAGLYPESRIFLRAEVDSCPAVVRALKR